MAVWFARARKIEIEDQLRRAPWVRWWPSGRANGKKGHGL